MIKIKEFYKRFARKAGQEITFHPKLNIPIRWVFKLSGKHYYTFVNDYEMPKKRFGFAQKFYLESKNKVTTEVLLDFIEAGKKCINEGKLGQTWKLLDELEYRTKWSFDPESTYRLASVMIFNLDENLSDYDFKYNDNKIDKFKKKGLLPHLLMILTNEQSPLSSLSMADSLEYLSKLNAEDERHLKLIQELKGIGAKSQKNQQTSS